MLLTPQWKKSIIPNIVQKIFTSFNESRYINQLGSIINTLNQKYNTPNYVGIKFQHQFYVAFKHQGAFQCHEIRSSEPSFQEFHDLINSRKEYETITRELSNYLATGLAMCHTTECMCEVFPEFILNAINEIHRGTPNANINLYWRMTDNDKFLAFIKKTAHIVTKIKKQLVLNILVPDNQNAKDPIQ